MTDALVSGVVNQLVVFIDETIREEVRLVVGVDKEIQNLKSTFEAIVAVLVAAEKRQIKGEPVKVWIEKLKDVSYDTDDVLAEWSSAILKLQIERRDDNVSTPKKKVCFFISSPCFCFNRVAHRRDIAVKIRDINERLDVIAKEKETYKFEESPIREEPARILSTSFIDLSEVRGRDEDKKTLVDKLLFESSRADEGLHIIAIVGMGGIGKTTLAQMVYNCDEVKTFQKTMWVCVSKLFDSVRVAKAIFEQLEGNAPTVVELEAILGQVKNSITGKKFLLVLDDVWTEDYANWEPLLNCLKNGAFGSKILVTTRSERVAKRMGSSYTLRIGVLSDQICWSLFSRIAYFEKSIEEYEELEAVGRKISDKCKGLPLAVKSIGSLMRCKTTLQDWQSVLNSEIWELEEKEDEGLLPPLLLSYYDLPLVMKRCFLYCANFPKDCKIEADNLIKLWMAHGYLNSRSEMEDTGRWYLENLVMRSFFQDLEKDKDGDRIIKFKMHDIFHDFAQYLTKNECLILEADSGMEQKVDSTSCKKSRHLTLIRGDDAPFPTRFPAHLENTEKLHTLWVQSFYDSPPIVGQTGRVPSNMLRHLTCLKALDLSRNMLGELPNEIEKLMNLRYLNLSHNPLEKLPETVCDLFNLQTLKLVACDHLSKLPLGLWKLINLRHFEIDRTDCLRALPKAIGRLSSLRTLSKFVISSGGDTEAAACKIIELKSLTNLRGCLKIEGLGYVADASEAVKGELKNKEHLSDLHLDFSPLVRAVGTTNVAEALQLHKNLKYLQMKLYGGTHFPSWMISLTNLRNLQLQDCQHCLCLPPLGKLPSLETLCIETMHDLKCVSHEFLGVEIDKDDDSTTETDSRNGGSSSVVTAFPKLKKLTIAYMRSWEEWAVIGKWRGAEEDNIRIMPSLRYLKLSHCERLKELPHPLLQMAPLKKLRIRNCPILKQRYQKGMGEDCNKVSHIPKCRIW